MTALSQEVQPVKLLRDEADVDVDTIFARSVNNIYFLYNHVSPEELERLTREPKMKGRGSEQHWQWMFWP
jgi:hypothetical protein